MNSRMIGSAAFIACLGVFAIESQATVVRFSTSLGSFDVKLFDGQTPVTVANFLDYVETGSYDQSIVHRSVRDFVIQGGGYFSDLSDIPANPAIVNESGIGNNRGTIAMARTNDPDSATNQWFINVSNNNFLDGQTGGFAVFGEVMGNGMSVVDAINDLQKLNLAPPFGELPVVDPNLGSVSSNLVTIDSIAIVPEPTSCIMPILLIMLAIASQRRRVVQVTAK